MRHGAISVRMTPKEVAEAYSFPEVAELLEKWEKHVEEKGEHLIDAKARLATIKEQRKKEEDERIRLEEQRKAEEAARLAKEAEEAKQKAEEEAKKKEEYEKEFWSKMSKTGSSGNLVDQGQGQPQGQAAPTSGASS